MICIVASTNRAGSRSTIVARAYESVFASLGAESSFLSLEDLTGVMVDAVMSGNREGSGFDALQATVDAADAFLFVIPEYNGSFPGMLKVLVDLLRYPDSFQGKVAALVGISSGTQGSALAMGHFADILNYCGAHTLALRPRLIRIGDAIEGEQLVDEEYLSFVKMQADQLVAFQRAG